MEDRMAEPGSAPADPWQGAESGYLWHRPWRPGRTLLVIVVTLFVAIYAFGVVYAVVSIAAEW
jgi:hypothetical protein